MKKYIGARYLGIGAIKFGRSGAEVKGGEITKLIPESDAIARVDFEPIYEGNENEKEDKRFKFKNKEN